MSTFIRGHARRAGLCLGVLGLLFVSACHDRVASPSIPVPSEFTLAVGKHVTIAPDQVEIGFRKVDGDSRCPTNVLCFWEGAAGVQLWLKPATRDDARRDRGQGSRLGHRGRARVSHHRREARPISPEFRVDPSVDVPGDVARRSALETILEVLKPTQLESLAAHDA